MALNARQQRFVDEYVIDFNAAAAARRAGYSHRTAKEIGAANLTKVDVAAAIREAVAALAKNTRVSAEQAWAEMSCIAFSDIGDILDMSGIDPVLKPANEIPDKALRALKTMRVKRYVEGTGENARTVEIIDFVFWDKVTALIAILKGLGELDGKVEHSGPCGRSIPFQVTGKLSHDPAALEAADAAFAESLAEQVVAERIAGFAKAFQGAAHAEAIEEGTARTVAEAVEQKKAADAEANAAAAV